MGRRQDASYVVWWLWAEHSTRTMPPVVCGPCLLLPTRAAYCLCPGISPPLPPNRQEGGAVSLCWLENRAHKTTRERSTRGGSVRGRKRRWALGVCGLTLRGAIRAAWAEQRLIHLQPNSEPPSVFPLDQSTRAAGTPIARSPGGEVTEARPWLCFSAGLSRVGSGLCLRGAV